MTEFDRLSNGEALVGRLDANGNQVIARAIGSDRVVDSMLSKEKKTPSEEDPVRMLARIVAESRDEERRAIIGSILRYAEQCNDRSEEIERAEPGSTRAGAFRIRSAIVADIAHKICEMWGRGENADCNVDSMDLLKETFQLKNA